MNLRKILIVVWFALVVALVVTIIPTGPKESEIVYTLKQMDDFRRDEFQREAVAFHAEVAEPIALRMVELVRPYTSPPFSSSTSTRELSSELGGPSAVVYFVVEERMPAWARGELQRRGEPVTSDNVFRLLQATPAWKEMVGLYDLFHVSENLPRAAERRDTFLDLAQEWLAELRETAVRLQVLEEDRVVSR